MAEQKIRTEWYHERIGRGYLVQVWDAKNPKQGLSKQYDVELAYGGRYICTLSTNAIGDKSANYWYMYHVRTMKRLMFLLDGMDMAIHNAMCYGKDLGGEPKEGYEEKWQEEVDKENMLGEWIDELLKGMGEKKYEILKQEFIK